MGLLSIFKRTGDASAAGAAPESGDAVQQARVRARRRLIGATVLLVIGVIGFPLVFETRPRPIPVDIPIEIPRKEGAPPLAMPPPRAAAPSVLPPVPQQPAANETGVITESRTEAGRQVAPRSTGVAERTAPAASSAMADSSRRSSTAAASAADPVRRAGATPAATGADAPKVAAAAGKATQAAPSAKPSAPAATKPSAAAVAKPSAAAVAKPAPAVEGSRAQAVLEAKPPAAEAGRYVVQVGAFAEAASARETRQKVEKLGLKTYTQVAQTPSGSRIRVRIGPFGTRAEADAALAKARAAGLKPVVLTL